MSQQATRSLLVSSTVLVKLPNGRTSFLVHFEGDLIGDLPENTGETV
jgi:hypothetical protein